jgi:hypothetical protein
MKRFNFLSVVVALVLMVAAVGCTTMQGAEDDYYGTQRVQGSPNRIYVDDPYRGTVVLERDPYSGRYYEVSPYGSTNVYGNRYDSRYDRRYYGSGRNNNRYYRNNGTYQPVPQQQPGGTGKDRGESRKKILGN